MIAAETAYSETTVLTPTYTISALFDAINDTSYAADIVKFGKPHPRGDGLLAHVDAAYRDGKGTYTIHSFVLDEGGNIRLHRGDYDLSLEDALASKRLA